jgi:hypothetical protein
MTPLFTESPTIGLLFGGVTKMQAFWLVIAEIGAGFFLSGIGLLFIKNRLAHLTGKILSVMGLLIIIGGFYKYIQKPKIFFTVLEHDQVHEAEIIVINAGQVSAEKLKIMLIPSTLPIKPMGGGTEDINEQVSKSWSSVQLGHYSFMLDELASGERQDLEFSVPVAKGIEVEIKDGTQLSPLEFNTRFPL